MDQVHDAYRAALSAYDALNTRVTATTGARLACCAGCSLCCSLRIEVYAHEVFLVVEYIRRTFSADDIAALMQRLAAHAAKVLTLTPFEHATQNMPCPLLVDGKCSVYAARPMTCRRHHSLDLRACQYTYDHPADLQFPSAHERTLYQALTEAMKNSVSAYAALALDTTIYELGTALEEALTDEQSFRDWLNHMEAFARASVTPSA